MRSQPPKVFPSSSSSHQVKSPGEAWCSKKYRSVVQVRSGLPRKSHWCASALFQDRFIPAGIACPDGKVLGEDFEGCLWVGGYSYYFGPDPGASKRIISFRMKEGALVSGPVGVLGYRGKGQSTILGMKQGPDGLYFADFFGEQTTGDAAGRGRVMKVSRSERTGALPVDMHPPEWAGWPPKKRGKYVFARIAGCGSCHTVERVSAGREGPDLTNLACNLRARLSASAYARPVAPLLQGPDGAAAEGIQAVLNARGDERSRIWLRNHIRNPRFDNPKGKMPQFLALGEEDLGCLVEYLMSLEK